MVFPIFYFFPEIPVQGNDEMEQKMNKVIRILTEMGEEESGTKK